MTQNPEEMALQNLGTDLLFISPFFSKTKKNMKKTMKICISQGAERVWGAGMAMASYMSAWQVEGLQARGSHQILKNWELEKLRVVFFWCFCMFSLPLALSNGGFEGFF